MWYSVAVTTVEFDYLYIHYINFLFSPVTVTFYFSCMAKLRFVNCCTNKRVRMTTTTTQAALRCAACRDCASR